MKVQPLSIFLILIVLYILYKRSSTEDFASSGAFHAITLHDRTNNIYNKLNKGKKMEKFDNIQKKFNPSNYIIFPYSSWELKPKFKKSSHNMEQDASSNGLLGTRMTGGLANFMRNDAGSGKNLNNEKNAENKRQTRKFGKHKSLILSRGGNKAK